MTTDDRDTIERAMCLRRMMNDYLRKRMPQERDRTMQIHLAQARGSRMNALLLRRAANMMIRIKKSQQPSEPCNG